MDLRASRARSAKGAAGLVAGVVALAVLVTGCSGGDEPKASGSPSPASSASGSATGSARPSPDASDTTTAAPSRVADPVMRKYQPVKRPGRSSARTVTAPAAPFDRDVTYSDGLRWTVTAIKQTKTSGQGVGEFPGEPQTRISLRMTNGGSSSVSLERVVVTALYGSPSRQARAVYDDSAQDFSGTVKPGDRASAVYSFSIPRSSLGDVSMYVDFDGRHTPARFTGRAAD